MVVVPEAFRFADGTGVLDPLRDDGYTLYTRRFTELAEKVWRPGDARPAGTWELAVCSRLPMNDARDVTLGRVFRDPAGERFAIACSVRVGDTDVDVVGVHVSSKLWFGAPFVHLRNLAPQLPPSTGPAIVAGDFNFWGPGVTRLLPGWRRAVLGRTFPDHRPHSQIDHILVNEHINVLGGEVLPRSGSDHLPVRARLELGTIGTLSGE